MHMQLVFVLFSVTVLCDLPLPQTAFPHYSLQPFAIIWNAPICKCQKLKIPLDFSAFQSVTTPERVLNQSLNLLYHYRTGLYPYIDLYNLTQYNGGIPQKGNLTASLEKTKTEFTKYISDSSPGLTVIDWEEWFPLFDRNVDLRDIYRVLSITYTLEKNPSLKRKHATAKAKQEFQKAAQRYMEETLKLGIAERPNSLWGFYLFPNCYNYDFSNPNYTGKCPKSAHAVNNQLSWLWETSTALFPSAYMPVSVSGTQKAALFVRHQVQEALRVAALPKHPYTAPVYLYLRPLLRDQKERYKSEIDLIGSIGESAALGAAGCVLWGSSYDYDDKASCKSLSRYLSKTLNQYIFNVTTAANLCSKLLCQGNGRCVRKDYESDDYLHLNPKSFTILKSPLKYSLKGKPSTSDLDDWAKKFTCQCYENKNCI